MTTPPDDLEEFPRLYALSQRFSAGKPRNFRILGDGANVLYLRARNQDDPTLCLWSFDLTGGTEQLLVDPSGLQLDDSQLSMAERRRRERARESGAGIVSYELSSSGQICFVLSQDLYLLDLENGDVRQVSTATPVFDPRFSPDGLHIAYVHGNNLRVVTPSRADSDRAVFESEAEDVSIGRADFIAAEEIGRSRGFWWSPDSRKLAAVEVDERVVQQWWIAQPSHPDASPQKLRYPPAGGTNSVARLLIKAVDSTSDPDTDLDVQGSGEDTTRLVFAVSPFEYLVDVTWTKQSGILISRQSRDQKTVQIDRLDIETNLAENLRTITDEKWVDIVPGAPRGTSIGLLTVENRLADDDSTIYKAICVDGEAVTTSSLDIRSILSIDESGDSGPVVTASVWSAPTSQTLVSVELDTGKVRQLGPNAGVNTGVFSGSTAIIVESSASLPGSKATIYRIVGGTLQPVHTIKSFQQTTNFDLKPFWSSTNQGEVESVVFLPANHDGTTQLPVLMDPYGGPHARRVTDSHDGHLVSQWFANHGFAVVVADGAGTPGRGVQREHDVWGDLATPVLNDQLRALDAAADQYGFLDTERVAIRGWSFGGYLSALAVLARPDRFHCAIAGAPVTDWRLYDTHYTERYLGHPDIFPTHYEQTDLLRLAENLTHDHPRHPLLLIHGLADDNVVAAHSLQLSAALLGSGYPHQFLPLSGVTHMTPQAVVAENLLRLQLDFLIKATQR